jgi:hypothetical protein
MHDKHVRTRKRMFRQLIAVGASLAQRDAANLTAWHYAAESAPKSFRRFVRAEYKRRLGHVPPRTFKRSELAE